MGTLHGDFCPESVWVLLNYELNGVGAYAVVLLSVPTVGAMALRSAISPFGETFAVQFQTFTVFTTATFFLPGDRLLIKRIKSGATEAGLTLHLLLGRLFNSFIFVDIVEVAQRTALSERHPRLSKGADYLDNSLVIVDLLVVILTLLFGLLLGVGKRRSD